jgi:hypothetical protein
MMPRSPIYLAAAALLVAATTACETQPAGGIAFVPTVAASPAQIQLIPQSLPLIPVLGSICPLSSPFTTRFNLVIGTATTDLFLQRLTLQPIDAFGVAGVSTILTTTDIVGSGSTLVGAGATRTFPLQPQFGCGVSAPQFFVADIVLADLFGSLHHTTLKAPFHP